MARPPTPDILAPIAGAIVRARTPTTDELVDMFGPAQDVLQRDAGRQDIPVDLIDDHPWQPRQDYDGIDELAADIQRNGLLQIPAGRRMADGRVQLQYGHRRLRAVKHLGWPAMPVDLQPVVSDNDMAVRAWVENHNRQDFTALDQARYFKRLQDDGWTQQQIAHGAAQLWWQGHTLPGHGPATPAQCRAARLRAQRQPQDSPPCQTDVSSVKP